MRYEERPKKVDLRKFSNTRYKPGSGTKRTLWYAVNAVFFKTPLLYPGKLKLFLLGLFGASIGKNVTIKPSVNIKYPWLLEIGDNVWIGEGVWIDSLGKVKIGNDVCISQGAYISTGNHNYKRSTFDLIIKEITIEDGVWIGARAIVCPGVKCGSHSVLTAGSVATGDLKPYKIYQGNPAVYKRDRNIEK
ncbi:MAG: WcaF family extracellular polysaccharide biosynthesis acetyltransferase [Candidatus Omnitrophota bacterium]